MASSVALAVDARFNNDVVWNADYSESEFSIELSAGHGFASEGFCINHSSQGVITPAKAPLIGNNVLIRIDNIDATPWTPETFSVFAVTAGGDCQTATRTPIAWIQEAEFNVDFYYFDQNGNKVSGLPGLRESTQAQFYFTVNPVAVLPSEHLYSLQVSNNSALAGRSLKEAVITFEDFSGIISLFGSQLNGGYISRLEGVPTNDSLVLDIVLFRDGIATGINVQSAQIPSGGSSTPIQNGIRLTLPVNATTTTTTSTTNTTYTTTTSTTTTTLAGDFNVSDYTFSIALKSGSREIRCGASGVDMAATGPLSFSGSACEANIGGEIDYSRAYFTIGGANACNFRELAYGATLTDPDIILYTDDTCLANISTAASRTVTREENASWCTPNANGDLALQGSVDVGSNQVATCVVDGNLSTSASPNTFIVRRGADVNLRSGETGMVRLLPGFRAVVGGYFSAKAGADLAARPLAQERLTLESSTAADTPTQGYTAAPRRLAAADLPAGLAELLARKGADIAEAYASADGQWVVFATAAPLSYMDANGVADVYLYYDPAAELTLVSARADGAAGSGASSHPRIDGYGSFLVFGSEAGDLVAGDANGVSDVFLYDIAAELIRRVSWTLDGEESANPARNPVLATAQPEIVYDRPLAATGLRSLYYLNYNWPQQGTVDMGEAWGRDWELHHPAITADGRFLAQLETLPGADGGLAECVIRITDYAAGASELFACTDEQLQGHGYDLEFAGDGLYLDLIPQAGADVQAYRIDNPLK